MKIIISTGLLFLMAFPVYAADSSSLTKDQKEPIEISADRALEWRRDDHQYTAHGGVIARQGKTEIHAHNMVADYHDDDVSSSGPTIYRLTARGQVRVLQAGGYQVTGDEAVYDVVKKQAIITGKNLKMTSPDQTVTARDRFEYWADESRIVAVGDAQVVRGEEMIRGDTITVWFGDDQNGKRVMTRAEAVGHVFIQNAKEQATGTRAIYELAKDVAILEGPVMIVRDQNKLNGTRAEINLKTRVSTLYGDGGKVGRVRGVFYTGGRE